jgi:hypothetical protein
MKDKRNLLALLISLIYVGIGTVAVCSVYPQDALFGEWAGVALLITFPVTILSAGFRYGASTNLLPVFIIQFIMLVPTFFIIKSFFKKKNTAAQDL